MLHRTRHVLHALAWPTAAVVIQRRSRLLFLLALGTGAAIAAVYGHATLADLPFALVDDDRTALTRTLDLSLDATRELTVTRAYPDFTTATAAVSRGELAGALWLPRGLTADLKRGHASRAALVVDGANILLSKTAQRAAETVLATVSAGAELTLARKSGLGRDAALALASPIALELDRPANPRASYAVYLAPGLYLFSVHLFALLFAAFLLAPHAAPRRLTATPLDLGLTRAANLVGALVPAAALLALFALVAAPRLGLTLHGPPAPLAAFGLAFVATTLLEAAALRALIPSPVLATQLTGILGALSLMLSGATFTLDLFPAPLAAFASALPLTPAADVARDAVAQAAFAGPSPAAWHTLASQAALFAALTAAGLLARAAVAAARHLAARRRPTAAAAGAPR